MLFSKAPSNFVSLLHSHNRSKAGRSLPLPDNKWPFVVRMSTQRSDSQGGVFKVFSPLGQERAGLWDLFSDAQSYFMNHYLG